MKLCPKCNIEKTSEAFRKDSRYKSGLTSWCKKCTSMSAIRRSNPFFSGIMAGNHTKVILNLNDEIEILESVRMNESDGFAKLAEIMKGLVRFHTLKHRSSLNDAEFIDLVNYAQDKMFDRARKLSKRPERRRESRRTGKPSLVNYLSINMRYDCIHFMADLLDRKWWSNPGHIYKDRKINPLTNEEKKEIERLIVSGTSPYKIARMFSISKDYAYCLKRKLFDPEGYEKYVKSNHEKRKQARILQRLAKGKQLREHQIKYVKEKLELKKSSMFPWQVEVNAPNNLFNRWASVNPSLDGDPQQIK